MNNFYQKPRIDLTKRLFFLICITSFTFILFIGNVTTQTSHDVDTKSLIVKENLKKHLYEIASDEYEGRGAGYAGERKAAEYIAKQFNEYGLKPIGDKLKGDKTYFQNFTFHARTPEKPFQILNSQNVIGFIEGSDKNLKKEIVVIGCHYDGQGKLGQADAGRFFPKDKDVKDDIWNSADDNASSIAVILEVARIISQQKIKPVRSILFIAFGAEENTLNGSAFYVENPVFGWKYHKAMLNLEKLGRIPDALPITASSGTSPIWETVTKSANKKTGMDVRSLIPELISDTDHYPFAMRRIPAMVIGMAHEEDTHLPTDSVDKISFIKLTERANYVLNLFLELANTDQKMQFTGNIENEVGFMVVVVSKDEIKQLGLRPEQSGFKVSMMMSKFAADKAGLKIGDVIIALDGINFTSKDQNDRIFFKENLANKSSFNLTIIRDGKRKDLKLRFSK